jgi:hypothetical protein
MGGQPTTEAGELASHGAPATVAVDSGRWWHGEAGKPVGITTAEWGPDLRVGGGEGLTGAALPMAVQSAEGAHR